MKKTLTLACLLLTSVLFAQQREPLKAGKISPNPDPIQLADYKAPSVTCIGPLSVNIMPTGVITLWSQDFLLNVTDNATPISEIQLAVRRQGAGNGFPVDAQGNPESHVLFSCNDLGTQTVELWARDKSGNASFCQTYVIVQDNASNCNGQPVPWNIEACTGSESGDGLEEVAFELSGVGPGGPISIFDLSDQYSTGCGYFDAPTGSDVTIRPIKDDNPLNGVTTYDLVLIAKHIEGTGPLNSPYKLIAADADRNGVINDQDIEEFHDLIVGVYTELPDNTSWRFVPKDFVFPDPMNPFATPFPEEVTIQNLQGLVSVDFVAIKVGDVNGTALVNNAMQVDERGLIEAEIGLPSPNPAVGVSKLPINMAQAGPARVSLSDIDGKVVWAADFQLEKGANSVDIPAPARRFGLYSWRVQTGASVKSGKLIFN